VITLRNSVFVALLFALSVGASAQKATPKEPLLNGLGWLSGCWEGRQGEAIIEEVWSKPRGDSMVGFGRTVKDGKTTAFEFMQVREANGSLTYLPQPGGGARVSFPLKDSFAERFTFENKEHDFPQRVIYERKGPGLLLAAIEGTYQGKEEHEEYQMKKVRCD